MTGLLSALLLGLVQGLTEFLPVSSSGHLEILNHLIGSEAKLGSDLTTVLIVHAGTAFSILFIFRKDIADILKDGISLKRTSNTQLLFEIVISMIPALIIGLLFEEQIEALFQGGILLVGLCLIFTGLVLWLTPNTSEDVESIIGWKKALLIGLAQAVAILPGISRSGMTIAIALMLGIGKKSAAKFSFLMVLPVILGKMLLDLLSDEFVTSEINIPILSIAFLTSFLVGIVACRWMIKLVRQHSLRYFALYCLILGIGTICFSVYG